MKNNFLVVSNYNNNIDWVKDYSESYVIYVISVTGEYIKIYDKEKIKKRLIIVYNIYD